MTETLVIKESVLRCLIKAALQQVDQSLLEWSADGASDYEWAKLQEAIRLAQESLFYPVVEYKTRQIFSEK